MLRGGGTRASRVLHRWLLDAGAVALGDVRTDGLPASHVTAVLAMVLFREDGKDDDGGSA